MRVVLALLAEYASIQEDGNKLHILGGGIEALRAKTFPFIQPNLALVLKLAFDREEWGGVHVVQVRITDEAGADVQVPRAFSLAPQPPPDVIGPASQPSLHESRTVSLPTVHNIRDLQFPRPGTYAFSVVLPDESVAVALPLQITGSTDEFSLQAILAAGYKAFVAGNDEAAWHIFEDAIRTAPGSPDAHNDFGFVSLFRDKPKEALDLFERARELGYQLTELVDANIACCHYLLGRYQEAFGEFRRLMGAELQNSPSVLFAIDREKIKPVELHGAVHFVSLMALNAGYSALSAGMISEGLQFAQIATAGRITFTEEKAKLAFVGALDRLVADCEKSIAEARAAEDPRHGPQGSQGPKRQQV